MFEAAGRWWCTARDLVDARTCEYRLVTRRAELAGLVPTPPAELEPIRDRAMALGVLNERRVHDRLVAEHGRAEPGRTGGVVDIGSVDGSDLDALRAAHRRTAAALSAGAAVVHRPVLLGDGFADRADLIRQRPPASDDDRADGPVHEVWDVKLGRVVRGGDVARLGAHSLHLAGLGVVPGPEAHILLGDGTVSSLPVGPLRPPAEELAGRVAALLARAPAVPVWGDPELTACGRCQACRGAVEASRDVFLVANVRRGQRAVLQAAGIHTIEELAEAPHHPADLDPGEFANLRDQAQLQVAQDRTGVVSARPFSDDGFEDLPAPSPGDVFLDFEGDPLQAEGGADDLGLEYLFGTVTHEPDDPEHYQAVLAHTRADEAVALEGFVDDLLRRRAEPATAGAHVYHYAPYEVQALRRLARRHGSRQQEVEDLVAAGVFVDLYAVVKRSVRTSQRSYSIKKLEPLYMGTELRTGSVADGAASVVAYVRYGELRDAGRHEEARAVLDDLVAYNRYDCVSTRRLRDWLLQQHVLFHASTSR